MKDATLEQGTKVLTLISQQETPCEQLQKLLSSGLLADLLNANVAEINRDEFRRVIGLKPFYVFTPPPGGRVHIVTVPVVQDRPWNEAVRAAGPNTPDNYDVWKVGDLYPATGAGIAQTKLVLVNFGPQGGSLAKAIAWAEQYNLKKTNPRQVFAIGEHKPQLHRELGMNPMYVVATEECSFEGDRQVCDVWWGDAEREVSLYWTGIVGSVDGWFAFLCES